MVQENKKSFFAKLNNFVRKKIKSFFIKLNNFVEKKSKIVVKYHKKAIFLQHNSYLEQSIYESMKVQKGHQ